MTREEAVEIKGEILKKEGEIKAAGIIIDGVVKLEDVLTIINQHISKEQRR